MKEMKQELHEIDQAIEDIHNEYKENTIEDAKPFLIARVYALYDEMMKVYEQGWREGNEHGKGKYGL